MMLHEETRHNDRTRLQHITVSVIWGSHINTTACTCTICRFWGSAEQM